MKKSLLFTLAFLGIGCASAPTEQSSEIDSATLPAESSSSPAPEVSPSASTAKILLQYEIKSDHEIGSKKPCTFRFREVKSGDIYEIGLDPSSDTALVAAPATGDFTKDSIYCGLSRMWRFPAGFESGQFKVYDGKVTYLGMLKLEFSNSATELKLGYHFDRDYETLKKFLGPSAKPDFVSQLVSGYTGLPLTEKILSTPKARIFPDIRVRGEKAAVDGLGESPDLTPCVQRERKINPLFFGRLTFVATYQQNKLSKLQRPENDHVYSESFIRCVKKSVAAFQPGTPQTVEFTISF